MDIRLNSNNRKRLNSILKNSNSKNNNVMNNLKNNKKVKSNKTNKLLSYILILFVIIIAPLLIIVYTIYLWFKDQKTNFRWFPGDDDTDKIARTKHRGTIVSCFICASSIVQATLKGFGASSTMLLLLYGFITANVIGFMGDQGFGTDNGFSLFRIGKAINGKKIEGFGSSLKYVFGTLASNSFWRFVITVFLDMFISAPLQSVIVAVCNPILQTLKNTIPSIPKIFGGMLGFVIKNFDNVLQSFVAFITFLAYANDVRFMWAYPGDDIDADLLISSGTIKLAVSIAGIVYLIANVSADYNIIEGVKKKTGASLVDTLPRKMVFVLVLIGLLTYGSLSNDSFMNYKQQLYQIRPINDYKKPDFWHYNQKLNDDTKEIFDKQDPKTGIYETCIIDKNGQLIVDYKKDTDTNKVYTQINQTNFKENEIDKNQILNTEYEKVSELWDKNKPCFIPNTKYICNKNILNNQDSKFDKYTNEIYNTEKICKKDNFNNTQTSDENKDKLTTKHINQGNLAKKADMGIFKLYSKETKYDIMNKYKKGFLIFCLYLFIGVCLPFLPVKYIYSKNEMYNASWAKFLVIMGVMIALSIVLYIIVLKSPSNDKLRDKELLKINENE